MDANQEIERYNPNPEEGLDEEIVAKRKQDNLINKTNKTAGKPVWKILTDNVLNVFNILLLIVAILLVVIKKSGGFILLGIFILSLFVNLYQDISARRLMRKYRIDNPKALVVRSNLRYEVPVDELVLDDVVELHNGEEVYADSIIIKGSALVDESSLTGNASPVYKNIGDIIFAGSFIQNGNPVVRVDKVKNSYSHIIQANANQIKKPNQSLVNSLKSISLVASAISLLLGIFMLVVFGLSKVFANNASFVNAFSPILNSIASILPWGLYLVSGLLLFLSIVQLKKNNVRVVESKSIETLSQVDVLCFDKTGTLTDGTLKVIKVVPYGSHSETTITGIINDFVNLIEDDTPTSLALQKYFNHQVNSSIIDKLNFNSDNKYSAVTFSSGSTFVLGSIDHLNINNRQGVLHRVEEFTSNGNQVIILAKANKGIKNGIVEGEQEVLGIVVLQEQIRSSASATIKEFYADGANIKVISGDNIKVTCEIARQAGINNFDQCISLKGLSIKEVKEVALQYTVFSDASAEQKGWIISSLKESGKKVAMVGDGLNDIIALKEANCSIAMNSGNEASKNVSDMVLMDSDLSQLRAIVKEGRNVNSYIYKTITLFLTKMSFAMVLAICFLFSSMISSDEEAVYPFIINHFYIWEIFLIAIPSILLVLDTPNKTKVETLKKAFIKSLGGSLASVVGVVAIFGMYYLQKYNAFYTGVYSLESAISMSVILFTVVAVFALLKNYQPFNKTRGILYAISLILASSILLVGMVLSFGNPNGTETLICINYKVLTPVNLVELGITMVVVITLYMVITYIIEVFKGEHLDSVEPKSKNKSNIKKTKNEESLEIIEEGENKNVNH